MSKLLINESPLQVQPSLAMAIGLNEAIFLQQLHYWLGASKLHKNNQKWIYNTYPEWLLQLKYMSLATLKRTIKSLKEQKLIHVERFDKKRSNQVNYYSIDYCVLSIIEQNIMQVIDSIDQLKMSQSSSSICTNAIAQNEPMDQLKMSQSPSAQNEPMLTREYQETTQEITQENISEKKTKNKFSLDDACKVDLPEGVQRDLWIAYVEMRHTMKKPPTQKAVQLALNDLTKWGFEKANQSLKNSITSNWIGLFEPKQAVQSYAKANQAEKPSRNVNDQWGNVQHYEPATDDVNCEGLI